MNYEKAYKDALERAKNYHKGYTLDVNPQAAMEYVFPELKESEDERIRKALIQNLKERFGTKGNMGKGLDMPDVLAWLEKQGEQKFPSLSEKEIVCLKRTLDFLREEHNSYTGKDFTNEIAVLEWLILHPVLIYPSELQQNQGEQKPAWSEKDSSCYDDRRILTVKEIKVGDIITYFRDGKKGIMLVSSFDAKIYPRCKWGITDIDGTAYGDWAPGSVVYYYATEEEKQQLYNTMPEYVKDWLKSIKDRVQPQPKQGWSEEDEDNLNWIIRDYERASQTAISSVWENRFKMIVAWLKSLKERYTWNPSDEQMKALNYVINLMASSESPTENDYYYNVFKGMREQLKKLMEE